MDVFGLLCGGLFWGFIILAWVRYVRSGRATKPVLYIGTGVLLAFIMLILAGYGMEMMKESLTSAAFEGDTASVERLVNMGVDINCKSENWHYTPLMCAAANGHVDTVKALLRHHPDLKKASGGKTAVGVAIENNHPDISRLLEAATIK